jgi:DNA-binding beta-propeller fold protein YncE
MIGLMRRTVLLALLVTVGWLPSPISAAAEMGSTSQPAPAGIAVDAEGNVYVSDYALDRVVKFGPEGTVLAQWGSSGSALGQFNSPFGVALDEHNTLYVVDQLNNRVQRFGQMAAQWPPGAPLARLPVICGRRSALRLPPAAGASTWLTSATIGCRSMAPTARWSVRWAVAAAARASSCARRAWHSGLTVRCT